MEKGATKITIEDDERVGGWMVDGLSALAVLRYFEGRLIWNRVVEQVQASNRC